MTRNEWIAETARQFAVHGRRVPDGVLSWDVFPKCVDAAKAGADLLEAANVAPWHPPAPALTDTAAKVVEAADPFIESLGHALFTPEGITLRDAVRAHLAAKQGGAS